MLCKRLVACMDVRMGRTVKGVRFQAVVDSGDPAAQALRYQEQGADEIVVLDITATPERSRTDVRTVERVADAVSIPLTVGGGVGSAAQVDELLRAGADRVSVNTAAVTRQHAWWRERVTGGGKREKAA